MTTIDLLLERLQDRDISAEAKKVIVQELEQLGVDVVTCIHQPNVKGRLVSLFEGEKYVVARQTTKSIWVFDSLGVERRFTKDGSEALQTGMTNTNDRVVVAL